MLDVAIVGGGLCGLALAHSLQARGRDWRLFETRDRLGGRALTGHAEDGTPVDLGPTWFWPHTQPTITRLVADLGLTAVDQLDDGRVLHLHDPQRTPQAVALTEHLQPAVAVDVPAQPGGVHGGARRVAGGIGTLVEALARPLPRERLRTGHRLEAVVHHGDFTELRLRHGAALLSVHARRVVLAMPPRVVASTVRFTPALEAEVQTALDRTPTWMATAAKAGFTYRRAFWHDAGHTGNAWVSHAQAMLAEVFDASTDRYAALAGFAALGAAQREHFIRGRDLLLDSQVVQLFGPEAADDTLRTGRFWQDWALEPETCSPTDIAEEGLQAGEHPVYGEPALGQAHWNGRLYFGGSESAQHGGGYMEGALGAAGRLRRQLLAGSAAGLRPAQAANEASNETHEAGEALSDARIDAANDAQLQQFERWVAAQRGDALARYRERLHLALSQQDDHQLMQRAVLGALESLYTAALQQLEHLPLTTGHLPVERGRAALTPRALAPFNGLADELLAQAVVFNVSSCALSNFPREHKPSGEYLHTIRRDLAAAWQSFAVATNACLLAKGGIAQPAPGVTRP